MKPFHEWSMESVGPSKDAAQEEIDNPWDLDLDHPVYDCIICGESAEVFCDDLRDFDPDMHYCGGSPSCCP